MKNIPRLFPIETAIYGAYFKRLISVYLRITPYFTHLVSTPPLPPPPTVLRSVYSRI